MSDTLEKRAHEIFRDWTLHCASKSTVQVIVEFARAELLKAAETAENALAKRDYTQSPPAVLAFDIANAIREQAQ